MDAASRTAKAEQIRRVMQADGPAVAKNTGGFNEGRYAAVDTLSEYEDLKKRARAIKEDAIAQLPELIETVRAQIEDRGGSVYLAEDADDANRYIADVVDGAERLVKSKSMTSEEIEVNAYLERRGLDVVETDLGEWVIQVADEAPSHIVAPAIHKSRAAIAKLFNKTFSPSPPLETAEELTRFARERLGALIEEADVGMTGANFIAAESGTLALVTSEGNARKTALVPPMHIAIAGVEKLIPTIEDLHPFVELIGRSATGQVMTSYLSLLNPPVSSPVPDFERSDQPMQAGERSFHLVLLDNGRMDLRDDPQLRETLYCIRCGACANSCANFQQVGGHAFGGETYSGGIGTGWEAGVHGLESAASCNELCTGCSRCVNACPVQIDIPWINTVVRDRVNRNAPLAGRDSLVDGLIPDDEPDGVSLRQRAIAQFDTLARWASKIAPVSNWVADVSPVRWVLDRFVGVDRRRSLPRFQRPSLESWFRRRGDEPRNPDVVLVPDTYTNYAWTERGQAAISALEAIGLTVGLSKVRDLGRPALSQGMIATARERAEQALEAFALHLEAGRTVVFVEPTDLAMVAREYHRLLSASDVQHLADSCRLVLDVVQDRLGRGADNTLSRGGGEHVVYHSHCQQRTLGLDAAPVEVLTRQGYDVSTTSAECCGMAGSFGYKSEYYELSMRVGHTLHEEIESHSEDDSVLVASGVSCKEQLDALVDGPVRHPLELLV